MCSFVLTDTTSGYSDTDTDVGNIVVIDDSCGEEGFGSPAGSDMTDQDTSQGASIWEVIAGTATEINRYK